MGNAGRVLMIPKGDYVAATTYEMLDCVYYNGRSYVCKETSTGNAPTNTTYWQAMTPDVSSDIATLSNVRAKLGAHNLIDINAYLTLSNTSIANNGIVSTATDSRNASIYFRCFKGSTAVGNALINQDISTGQFSKEITIPSNYDFDLISIGHNGASKDLKVSLPFSKTGTFIFSCNVTGANTSVSGGYALEDIMLRLADDKSTVYGEFSKPNTELTKDDIGLTANAFENGAVNEFEVTASSGTVNEVVYVVNSDKTVTVTVSQQAASQILFTLGSFTFKAGKRYKLSGCPSGGSVETYGLYVSGVLDLVEEGNGLEIICTTDTTVNIRGLVRKNCPVSTFVFKPMITVADMPNSDYAHYVPYAKSNRQLTDELATNEYVDTNISWASDASTYFTLTNATKHFRVNKFLHHCIVDVDGVVLNNGWSASDARPLLATGNNSYNPPYSKRTLVPFFQNGSIWYKMYVSKANSHDGVALTALESIPSGTSLSFTLEWTY